MAAAAMLNLLFFAHFGQTSH